MYEPGKMMITVSVRGIDENGKMRMSLHEFEMSDEQVDQWLETVPTMEQEPDNGPDIYVEIERDNLGKLKNPK